MMSDGGTTMRQHKKGPAIKKFRWKHACPRCEQRFKKKDRMRLHLRTAHREPPASEGDVERVPSPGSRSREAKAYGRVFCSRGHQLAMVYARTLPGMPANKSRMIIPDLRYCFTCRAVYEVAIRHLEPTREVTVRTLGGR